MCKLVEAADELSEGKMMSHSDYPLIIIGFLVDSFLYQSRDDKVITLGVARLTTFLRVYQ